MLDADTPVKDEPPDRETRGLAVVGIGASAGGLEALEALFAAMPEDSGMAFVVLQHLSPDFESRMVELLARRTRIPIQQVTDGLLVEPNHIYLIPPRKDMILSGGHLLLTDKEPARGLTLPIDHFLRSLAQDAGANAIAVILSGTGSDGSRGIREVHEAGGLIISQEPTSARFDGMPRSAMDTGVVDLELPPAAIPEALVRYRAGSLVGADFARSIETVPDSPLGKILELLRGQYGIDFAHYKPATVLRRIERRLTMGRHEDVEAYAEQVGRDKAELNALYFDLLIGVTRFFRDAEAFEYLEGQVLPKIIEGTRDVRIWVSGCATGEEVYSIAILLHEAIHASNRRITAKIFATDVHPESLETASAGIYGAEALRDVSPERRERFFAPTGDRFKVVKELRELAVFARHNVLHDAPFTRLDLVSCRNLLIYFQPAAQKKALSLFHFGLKTSGFLMLGTSESPGDLADEFETLESRWKIYRKRRDIRLPADIRLPTSSPKSHSRGSLAGHRAADSVLLSAYDQLMARHVPPSFLVDKQHELLHSFGGAESLLVMRGGRISTNLLDLLPDGLRAPMASALQQAAKQGKAARYTGVDVPIDGGMERYQITVEPLIEAKAEGGNFLVELERQVAAEQRAPIAEVPVDQASREYVESLEGELHYTRENLQATVEELETSNEELQATNEELVAANEELQSTNEELHSVNEELHTVNSEHQRKIEQLTEITEDLDNLLWSTDIGVLFLDPELGVRKFTPRMAEMFHLLPQDIGRKFDHFAHNVDYPELLSQIRDVLATGQSLEGEMAVGDAHTLLVRVLPYRSKGQVRGVVVAVVDLSTLRRAETEARRLSAIIRTARDAIVAQDLDGRITAWNRGAEELFGFKEADAIGQATRLIVPDDLRDLEGGVMARLIRGESIDAFETRRLRRDGRRIDVELSLGVILDGRQEVVGVATIARDIAVRKRQDAQIRAAVSQREQFLALLSHELRNPLMGLSNAVRLLDQPDVSAANQASAREVVRRQVQQMSRLLEDLLDSSRMRRDRIELSRTVFDLRDAVAAVMDAAGPAAAEASVHVDMAVPDYPIHVEADLGRLQQLQVNLLNNAISHSKRGGRVKYCLEVSNGRARVTVEDDGAGISADDLPHVFEPFFQGARRRGKGMGLGLSLASSIAKAHGGTLEASSDGEGKGARFSALLPLCDMEAVERRKAAGRNPVGADHRLVLLVDDDDDARELLGILLENAGHEVIQAANGRQGLDLLVSRRPRAAIVDLGLPDISGLEVARRARERLGPDMVKLIALTGFGQQKDREAAAEAGFDHHLVKPLDFDTIASVLEAED